MNLVVEGRSDIETAKAVVRAAGHTTGKIRDKGGISRLDPDIRKYNEAAKWEPWVVFRDTDSACPVSLHAQLVADISIIHPGFQLRLANSMTEAWLLADRRGFARFFGIPLLQVPADPESLAHAKRTVLHLAATSRIREIREGLVAGQSEAGPLYGHLINQFARDQWDVLAAAGASESLRRAVRRIGAMQEVTPPIDN